jgi:hypothetical protein
MGKFKDIAIALEQLSVSRETVYDLMMFFSKLPNPVDAALEMAYKGHTPRTLISIYGNDVPPSWIYEMEKTIR